MLKIAHMINPVKVDKKVDLYWAQPVTFESMRIAKEYAEGTVDVTLYSAHFPEDADFVPDYFIKTKHLERSVLDIGEFYKQRKLPLLKDILDRLYSSSDADFLIYSNCDIAIMPYFYTAVAKIIEAGRDAFVINRRTISRAYSRVEDIPFMYAAAGQSHKGYDCFVFKRDLYPQLELGRVCIGIQVIGRLFVWNLFSAAKKFEEYKDRHLTFHIGNDRLWQRDEYLDYKIHNQKEAQIVLKKLDEKFNSVGKLGKTGYLGAFKLPGKKTRTAAKKHKFLFIAGLHRSGTTVLADCLKEHPLISGFESTGLPKDEGQFLQSVYPLAWKYGGPGKFGFSKEMHLTEHSLLITEGNREKLFREWSEHWDLSKPILLEKSPPNILKTRFLQDVFPDSYFIVIMRHPVANAYANQKWSETSIYSLLKHWIICHRIFYRDKKHLKNVFLLKYEDFVKNPDQYLLEIYRFLGIEKQNRTVEVRKDINETYLSRWQAVIEKHNRLKKMLRLFKYRTLEKKIKTFGYSLYKPD